MSISAIFAPAGPDLSDDEKAFFKDAGPAAFILFARNIESPDQVRKLIDELHDCTGSVLLPIMVDQEGGRVQRLGPPHWRKYPAMGVFGKLAGRNKELAKEALFLNVRLLARELCALGINVNTLPVLDVPVQGADDIIGDRALSPNPGLVAELGEVVISALLAEGVAPVIKHIPGHGRARVDSHKALPVVDADAQLLRRTDFFPFSALASPALAGRGGAAQDRGAATSGSIAPFAPIAPFAMTAHVVYSALDADNPVTFSKKIIGDLIREEFGYDGLLMSDDLSMGALEGDMTERTKRSLTAGCDLVLHCNGKLDEMTVIADASVALSRDKQLQLDAAVGGDPSNSANDTETMLATRDRALLHLGWTPENRGA